MKIKHQLLGFTSLSLLALFFTIALIEVNNLKLFKAEKTIITLKNLEISLLDLKRIKLEFLDGGEISTQDGFSSEYQNFKKLSTELSAHLEELEIVIPELNNLNKEAYSYEKDFFELVNGYGKDIGHDLALKEEMNTLFNDIFSIFYKI